MPAPGSSGTAVPRDGRQEPGPARWLLLIHQVPPKPDYLRIKVRRRLDRLGAVPLKNSVYVLPRRDGTLEDFQWLAREIAADGGEASVCEAAFLEGVRDEDVVAAFRAASDAEYAEIATAARALGHARSSSGEVGARTDVGALTRLARRMAQVAAIDYFDAPARAAAEEQLRAADDRLRGPPRATATSTGARGAAALRGRTWVTREGVHVDRIASAWLIRRFIDADARFRFVPAQGYRPAPGELRFDMFEAEYTHDGDRCTFETLLERFDLRDSALRAVADVVHDIDCKDEKFARPETPGVERLVDGIATAHATDASRLERGALLFDDLYAAFRTAPGAP